MDRPDVVRFVMLLGLCLVCATSYLWRKTTPTYLPPSMDPDNRQNIKLRPNVNLLCGPSFSALKACIESPDNNRNCDDHETAAKHCSDAVKTAYSTVTSMCRMEVYELMSCIANQGDIDRKEAQQRCSGESRAVDMCGRPVLDSLTSVLQKQVGGGRRLAFNGLPYTL